jgi:hypothetical protein
VGLDIEPCAVDDPSGRIRIYRGGQADTAFLDQVAAETAPEGFDIIIDDCSHMGELTRISFWHLFEHHLKPGGLYSIEDWGTSYWDDWPDGKRYAPPAWPSKAYRSVFGLAGLFETATGRKIGSRWLWRLVRLACHKQRFRSHDYGMAGFIKQLVDEAAMGDATDPSRGIGPHRPSKFRRLEITHGQVIVIKSKETA